MQTHGSVCACVHKCVHNQTLFMFLSGSEAQECATACNMNVWVYVHLYTVSLGIHGTCVIKRDDTVLPLGQRDDAPVFQTANWLPALSSGWKAVCLHAPLPRS